MDRREGMPFSGSSYYMQRGMASSTSGLQGSPTMYPLSAANAPFQSTAGGTSMGSTIPVEPSTMVARAVSVGAPSATPPGEPIRRKRGRPRKYGPDAKALMPLPSPSSSPATSSPPSHKRGRGRPPGTGRKQQLASIGGWLSSSAGIGFTPHVIPISVGEDIATKILSFSQQSPRAICVLSANGAISTVTLRQPSSSGSSTVTYEGRFEILCLSGSYLLTANSGSHNRIGGLSVSLASPDGRVIGGGVGGVLIAASPVQVIVGSFTCGNIKGRNKAARSMEGGGVSQHLHVDNSAATLESVQPNQNLASSSLGIWPVSQQMDVQTAHADIDLMH